jgi:hypothetical protein
MAGLKPVFILDALRGAEAPLFHGVAWDRGFQGRPFWLRHRAAGGGARSTFVRAFGVKVKIKVNVKGNGQECPFHTGKSNSDVKNGAAGVRGSHLSQKTRKMGHPAIAPGRFQPFDLRLDLRNCLFPQKYGRQCTLPHRCDTVLGLG